MPMQYVQIDPAVRPRLTTDQTRIQITQYTPRWVRKKKVDPTQALDFWSAAGAAANVVMQLVNKPVAYGVMESPVDSGALYKHPVKRTRTTISYLAVAVLGTPEDKARYREAVNTAHRQVRSTASSPVKYNAMDRGLQLGGLSRCLLLPWMTSLRLAMDLEHPDLPAFLVKMVPIRPLVFGS